MSRKSDLISIVTFVSILAVTGVALIAWMSAKSWVDTTGLTVGIILLVLTVLQSVLSVVWWRVTARKQHPTTNGQRPHEIELKPMAT